MWLMEPRGSPRCWKSNLLRLAASPAITGNPGKRRCRWRAITSERSTAINPAEAVEEKVSLSDRFGLWLGFHNCDQDTYFAIVEGYARHYGLKLPVETLRGEANEWSVTRGARSGRVAWQYIQDLAGRLGRQLE